MKKVLFIPVMILSLMIGQVASAAFSDVTDETSYSSSIQWMADNGVIQGYPDGTFMPDQCVNRAEFLKMMYLTLGTNIIVSDAHAGSMYYADFFSDVSPEEWYWPYVDQGIRDEAVQGYPDGTFKPGQCVNRAEAVKMAVVAFDLLNEESLNRGDNVYRDVLPGNNWFDVYIYSAVDRNAVGKDHVTNVAADSMPEIYFHPGDSMTRKEVAEMLYRMKTLTDNGVFGYVDTMSPNPINYYVSPSNGVSFIMPDGWEVTQDNFYATATGVQADYPTILIKGTIGGSEVTVAINQRQMDCGSETYQATCFNINDNYIIGAFNPNLETSYLINRIMLTFREPTTTTSSNEIAFDSCGTPSDYANEAWWTSFVDTWDAYALTLTGAFPSMDALDDSFGDYCLALDKSTFIFIPNYFEDNTARVFKYDINSDTVEMASDNGIYDAREFGARVGLFIPVYGIDDYYGCQYKVGDYYYLENRIDVSTATTCTS